MENRAVNKKRFWLLCLLVIVFYALETFLLGGIIKVEGVKIGLYNAFIIYAILNMKPKHGFFLAALKLITSIFIGTSVLLYPLCGTLFSVLAMTAASRIFNKKVGYLGIGILGAVTYNITIYVVAALSLSSKAVFYNIPTVLFLSVVFGAVTGSLAYLITKIKLIHKENGGMNEKR